MKNWNVSREERSANKRAWLTAIALVALFAGLSAGMMYLVKDDFGSDAKAPAKQTGGISSQRGR